MSAFVVVDSDSDLMSIANDDPSDDESLFELDNAIAPPSDASRQHDLPMQSSIEAQAAKAIQVARDLLADEYSATETSPLTRQTAHEPTQNVELPRELILDAGPAPPDYHAATASRRQSESTRNLLPLYTDNESDELYVDDESAQPAHPPETFSRELRTRRKPPLYRQFKVRVVVACFVLAFTISAIFVTWFRSPIFTTSESNGDLPEPDSFNRPQYLYDPLDRLGPDSDPKQVYAGYQDFHFTDLESFEIAEKIDCTNSDAKQGCLISGSVGLTRIHLKPFHDNMILPHGVQLLVRVGLSVSKEYRIDKFNVVQSEEKLSIQTPDIRSAQSSLPQKWDWFNFDYFDPAHFVYWVEIYVREDLQLTNWLAHLRFLDFRPSAYVNVTADSVDPIHQSAIGSAIRISNHTTIESHYGDLGITYWDSRTMHISSRTGNAGGQCALHDAVTIENWSGSIDFGIEPKNRSTNSDPTVARVLETVNRSGNTSVRILPGPIILGSPNGSVPAHLPPHFKMEAKHSSSSGPIALEYPLAWEGFVDGVSVYGKINTKGTVQVAAHVLEGNSTEAEFTLGSPDKATAGHVWFGTESGNVDIARELKQDDSRPSCVGIERGDERTNFY